MRGDLQPQRSCFVTPTEGRHPLAEGVEAVGLKPLAMLLIDSVRLWVEPKRAPAAEKIRKPVEPAP